MSFFAAWGFRAEQAAPSGVSEYPDLVQTEVKNVALYSRIPSFRTDSLKKQNSENSELCCTDETFPPSLVQSGITARPTNARESKTLWMVSKFLPILEREKGCASSKRKCFQFGLYFSFQL